MPTFDETSGKRADEIHISIVDIPISRIVVESNKVTFYDGNNVNAFSVERRVDFPGAGLALEMREDIEQLSVEKVVK